MVSRPAVPPAQRSGRNGPCPCGSGRKFKQCCGTVKAGAVAAGPRPGVEADRLNLGPLSEAGKLREAIEGLRQSLHGAGAPILETAPAPTRHSGGPGRPAGFAARASASCGRGNWRPRSPRFARRPGSIPGTPDRRAHSASPCCATTLPPRPPPALSWRSFSKTGSGSDHHNLAVALDRQGLMDLR